MRKYLFYFALLLVGCGGDGDGFSVIEPEPLPAESSSPEISNLVVSPDTVIYMQGDGSVTATAQFSYTDNDLDIDMLAVVESLLDTWPGTLLLITHDRWLMERVTDHQFALLGGKVRHVPGGVDEYLRLLDEQDTPPPAEKPTAGPKPKSSAAEERLLKKELASTERKIDTASAKVDAARTELAETDPTDYQALLDAQARLAETQQHLGALEDAWVELSDRLLG